MASLLACLHRYLAAHLLAPPPPCLYPDVPKTPRAAATPPPISLSRIIPFLDVLASSQNVKLVVVNLSLSCLCRSVLRRASVHGGLAELELTSHNAPQEHATSTLDLMVASCGMTMPDLMVALWRWR